MSETGDRAGSQVRNGLERSRGRTRRATRIYPTMRGIVQARSGSADTGPKTSAGRKAGRTPLVWYIQPRATVSQARRRWLTAGDALTGHLARVGAAERDDAGGKRDTGRDRYAVNVRVTREARQRCWPDEAALLNGMSRGRGVPVAWVREVVLSIGDVPCVVAHSVTSLRASRGVWRAMRTLRTRPLADLLYRDPTVRRSLLTSRIVPAQPARRDASRRCRDPVTRQVATVVPQALGTPLLVRRSVFERAAAPLVITECFLPAFWDMAMSLGAR